MIEAEKLRNKAVLNNVSVRPGYYKWWAKKAELDVILSALNAETPEITAALEEKEGLYCIYVGIAVKESLRKRLDWHVNDKHTASKVKNGTLSTLRQSIASIVAHNQYDKKATDAFIDKLYVEAHCMELHIVLCGFTKSGADAANLVDLATDVEMDET